MGVINMTPDSFSGDGLYKNKRSLNRIVDFAKKMIEDGADIIDVGGESTRPGAKPVDIKEELSRTIPLIKKLTKAINIPISIDTYKPEVARQALDNGVCILNDITGLRLGEKMAKLVKKYGSGIILMHMRGSPKTMQKNPRYKSLINDIIYCLKNSIDFAKSSGIERKKIIIDPGIGFGKTVNDNLKIINNLDKFKVLKQPILIGVSRKSFIGKILDVGVKNRLIGSIAAECVSMLKGVNIVRVHDVKETKQAISICGAILHS